MIDEIILLTTNNKIDDKFLKVAKKKIKLIFVEDQSIMF